MDLTVLNDKDLWVFLACLLIVGFLFLFIQDFIFDPVGEWKSLKNRIKSFSVRRFLNFIFRR